MNYNELRHSFKGKGLSESDILDPFDFLNNWIDEALKSNLKQPNAMCLSSVSNKGIPSSRVVLLKEILDEKIIFYTDYDGEKSVEISTNPHVAINFCWLELNRQVRIKGKAAKCSREKSVEYFNSRPRGSQVAASVSNQSQRLSSRESFENSFNKLFASEAPIVCPENWGGFEVSIDSFEFWQGRDSRLHDRIVIERNQGDWTKYRIYP